MLTEIDPSWVERMALANNAKLSLLADTLDTLIEDLGDRLALASLCTAGSDAVRDRLRLASARLAFLDWQLFDVASIRPMDRS